MQPWHCCEEANISRARTEADTSFFSHPLSELSIQAFSSVVSDLYQASENPMPQAFQQEAFRLLRQLLFFDGGISGVVSAERRPKSYLHFSYASVYGRSRELLPDFQGVAADDPVMRRLLNGLTAPHACSCRQVYRERHLLHLFAFAKKHDINETLIFGEPVANTPLIRWIILYRRSSHSFDAEDAMSLRAWWPHWVRSTQLNLRHTLDHRSISRSERAVALIGTLGRIEASDRLFSQMLQEEWPQDTGQYLPKAAWSSLKQKGLFRGRTLSLTARNEVDHMVCEAQRLSELDRLGALERTVALLVAEGHDYKAIAAKMGTSPNTVRNQISRIYKKLNVHDKLSLALLFRQSQNSAVAAAQSPANLVVVRTGTHAQTLPLSFDEKCIN